MRITPSSKRRFLEIMYQIIETDSYGSVALYENGKFINTYGPEMSFSEVAKLLLGNSVVVGNAIESDNTLEPLIIYKDINISQSTDGFKRPAYLGL